MKNTYRNLYFLKDRHTREKPGRETESDPEPSYAPTQPQWLKYTAPSIQSAHVIL